MRKLLLSVMAVLLPLFAFPAAAGGRLTAGQKNSAVEAGAEPIYFGGRQTGLDPVQSTASLRSGQDETTSAPKTQYVTMLFAGDVMAHQKQIDSHKFGSSYDFRADFVYIKRIVSAADIAVANLEAPLSGKKPYTGYPSFNAPDELADALYYAGFDVIATANNHIRDKKDEAMLRTCRVLKSKGFGVIGTAAEAGEPKYLLAEKNGIKIGFVNFTNSINRGSPYSCAPYVNCLRYGNKSGSGYQALEDEITALRQSGAEFIVVFLHWGSEYKLKGNAAQRDAAERIADMGADLIIGGHPHVPQNVDEYASPVTGKNVLIYYSLGNLVSNMSYNHGPGGGNCETGALALVRLKRCDNGSVVIDAAGYLTTYVHKPTVVREYSEDGRQYSKTVLAYYIVPAKAAAAYPATYVEASGSLLDHIEKGAENGDKVIGSSGKELTLFKFSEYTVFPWGTDRLTSEKPGKRGACAR